MNYFIHFIKISLIRSGGPVLLLLSFCTAAVWAQPENNPPVPQGNEDSKKNKDLKNLFNRGYHQSKKNRFKNPARHRGLGSGTGGASSSNASNYGGGSSISVNPRTGGVSLEAELFNIHGINEDIDLSFALTYLGEHD